MNDTKMDAAVKKLRERGYRMEVFGPSPEGRFMVGVNGELKPTMRYMGFWQIWKKTRQNRPNFVAFHGSSPSSPILPPVAPQNALVYA
jgi:hypothetical protein